ncbi:PAS domain-containing protein [Brucepastera parasyntrophica]|uniref:histidine kinase N-terminal 7TM domain-containing protein n=1 Tax=Brucepastera parasyntrophica TaxID=2880008 RepID=UPI002108E3A1|nr:PAS domain-containing protein [Brucepastera parasyntrophica]ULQ60566.1 PAS domain-containing protein [Brucepastera parasyntrophica]
MTLSGILIVISFMALLLGIYAIYNGRKGASVNWSFVLLAFCSFIWSLVAALYMAKISDELCTFAVSFIECCVAAIFPLLTSYFIVVLGLKSRLSKSVFVIQIILTITLILVNIFHGFVKVTIVNGKTELEFIKNITYYLFISYNVLCPLANIIMFAHSIKYTEYKRDRHQAISWIFYLLAGIGFLLIRYIPELNIMYGGGCFVQFAGLVMLYNFSLKYNASAINTINVAEYVYSSVNTPFLVLSQKGAILLSNNSASKFFGKSSKDLLGTDIKTLFHFDKTYRDFSKTGKKIL